MKLGRDMYHVNTFHLHQNEGGSELVGRRGIQKSIKKCHEFSVNSALARSKNSLKKAINVGFVLLSSSSIWL